MKKRALSFVLVLLFSLSCGMVSAAQSDPPDARSSLYLTQYRATASSGVSRGTVKIYFEAASSKAATSVGVKEMVIYKSNGTKVTTITGTNKNGLQKSNATRHSGTYTYSGSSGVQYYAKVTLFAKNASGSSSKTVTTSTVTAP